MKTLKTLTALATVITLGLGVSVAQADILNKTTDQLGVTAETGVSADVDVDVTTDAEPTLPFASIDENADGVVSQAEFDNAGQTAVEADAFAKLDVDSNGSLDESEFEKLASLQTEVETETKTEAKTY